MEPELTISNAEYSQSLLVLRADMPFDRAAEAIDSTSEDAVVVVREVSWQAEPYYYVYPRPLIRALVDHYRQGFGNEFAEILFEMFEQLGRRIDLYTLQNAQFTQEPLEMALQLAETKSSDVSPSTLVDSPDWSVVLFNGHPTAYRLPPPGEEWDPAERMNRSFGFSETMVGQSDEPPRHITMAEPPPPFEPQPESAPPAEEIALPSAIRVPSGISVRGEESFPAGPPQSPPPSERYLNARGPENVTLNQQFPLTVRVESDSIPITPGAGSISFDGGNTGRTVSGQITLDLNAPGFKCLELTQTLDVPEFGASAPARFVLTAQRPGLHKIEINAYKGSAYLGAVNLAIGVDTAEVGDGSAAGDMEMRLPEGGEYTLEVEYDEQERTYTFRLRGDDFTWPPVESAPLQGPQRDVYDRIVTDMNARARNLYNASPSDIRYWLEGMGADLFRELLPNEVKEALWQNEGKIKRLNILARNDNIPWEILYVMPRDDGDGRFLVDSCAISRWSYGRNAPLKIGGNVPRYVLPRGGPPASADELKAIEDRMGIGSVVDDISTLNTLLRDGGFGLLHFIAHNVQTQGNTDRPYIPFENGQRFDLTYMGAIRSGRYKADAPLVFMNACTTAGSKPIYTEIGGWASRFLDCGTGAFVGSLWEVRDKSAAKFAAAFYDSIKAGDNLGNAMAAGRRNLDAGDPTYLAYTLYGNPLARYGGI